MDKKRCDYCRWGNKKAQITIFMILGLVILFVIIFLIQLNKTVRTSQIETAQEQVIGKTFRKEALRIYVEDCLEDGLDDGLRLLGNQGGIWKGQGGTKRFSEGVNGIEFAGSNIFYGITNQKYAEHENKYPCKLRDEFPDSPFCKYAYPRTDIFFGKNLLRMSIFEKDLEKYLEDVMLLCVKDELLRFSGTNVTQLKLSAEGADFNLRIIEGGVSVKVHYPLTLRSGGQEFFHLSEFDFFFPTKLKKLFDAAVIEPFGLDWQFVDFDLTKDVLQKPLFIYGVNSPVPREECTTQDNHFTCSKKRLFADTYNNLDIELNKIEVGQGDDIFEFKPAWDEEGLKDYVFRVARQNRPPALDYISRCPAEEYDYLVVKNDPYLGKINFTAFARDPDEDGVELSFAVGGQQISASDSRFDKLPSEVGSGENIVLTVSASDGYLRDWQDVRINVAPRLEPEIRIWNALLGKEHEQAEILSIEDPVCLEINTKNLQTIDGFSLNLQRGSLENLRNGQNGLFSSDGNIFASCELDMFDIESIEEQMKKVFHTGSNALHLQGRVPYGEEEQCGYDVDVTKTMEVKACLPWRGSQDPFIPGSSSGSNFKLNHSCCEGTIDDSSSWKLASEGKICSEREGCFNATEPFYLYQKVRRCGDAQGKVRGNLCGGDEKVIRLQRGRDICGDSALSSCRMLIARECVRNEAWSFISNEGWCHGNSGCNRFCDSEVVDPLGMTKAPGFLLSRDGKHLKCGCRGQLDGSPCDENFDGVFGGQCIGGSCTEA